MWLPALAGRQDLIADLKWRSESESGHVGRVLSDPAKADLKVRLYEG
jgi:hypothetical protein